MGGNKAKEEVSGLMNWEKEFHKSIVINAPAIKVWEVLTQPQHTRKWLSDDEIMQIISDYKVGGSIIFKGKWHGADFEDKGTILNFEPATLFSYTNWSKHNNLPDAPENYSTVSFVLTEIDKQTTLSLHVSNMLSYEAYGHIRFYWNMTFGIIKKMAEELA